MIHEKYEVAPGAVKANAQLPSCRTSILLSGMDEIEGGGYVGSAASLHSDRRDGLALNTGRDARRLITY